MTELVTIWLLLQNTHKGQDFTPLWLRIRLWLVDEWSNVWLYIMSLNTSMDCHVSPKIAFSCRSIFTRGTTKWLLSSVFSDMYSQASLLCGGIRTELALEWFLASMNTHMILKICSDICGVGTRGTLAAPSLPWSTASASPVWRSSTVQPHL